MKKFFSLIIISTLVLASVPSYAYADTTVEPSCFKESNRLTAEKF